MSKSKTDVGNSIVDREIVEFEELNRWLRSINNMVWTVTSVFFGLSIIAIKPITELLKTDPNLCKWIGGGFILLWVLTILFTIRIIIVTVKIMERIKDLKHWNYFLQAIEPSLPKNKQDTLRAAVLTPWGILIIPLAIFMIIIWLCMVL